MSELEKDKFNFGSMPNPLTGGGIKRSESAEKPSSKKLDLQTAIFEESNFKESEAAKPEVKKPEVKEPKTKTKKTKISWWRNLGFVLVGVQAITSILLMISLITMNIIGGFFIVIVAGILLVLLALTTIKLTMQK